MVRNKPKPKGWVKEPVRHGQAARGIKTATPKSQPNTQLQVKAREMEDKAHRLEEIKGEMDDLLEDAYGLLRGTREEDAARGYWYAHIKGALDKDESGFLGGSMIDMQGTIDGLESEASDLRIEAAGPGEPNVVREMMRQLNSLDTPSARFASNQLARYLAGESAGLKKAIELVHDDSDRDWYSNRQREMLRAMEYELEGMQRS